MALFFDAAWFDAQLAERHLTRAMLAALLGYPEAAIDEMFKDQRELSPRDVAELARLFHQPPEMIALKAGVSTPVPAASATVEKRLELIEERLSRIEAILAELVKRD
ncbi:MAG TPA: hypothetical protein PL096_04185 [Micropepsaceae bacterium]|nr:hypothetical protein [Micropepsaceae bacterium]